ncbi:hypothetical protein KSC_002570 [Ktedonobacter sp. SOSP1-52]|nr:hypothetical protein KSC_002570 [Ktedonobacter sp. SOSP1-52]
MYVLSAEFGLIPAGQPIPLYDRVMTTERARELQPQIQEKLRCLLAADYNEICLALSQLYLPALEGWESLLSPTVSVTITDGPMATKSNQLRAWLQGETWKPTEYPPDYQILAKENPREEVILKGVPIRLTKDEIFEKARTALEKGNSEATNYRDWYVLIDDTPVAPKWLVQLISGVSVRDFDASAARRVLGLLGVDVRRAR